MQITNCFTDTVLHRLSPSALPHHLPGYVRCLSVARDSNHVECMQSAMRQKPRRVQPKVLPWCQTFTFTAELLQLSVMELW